MPILSVLVLVVPDSLIRRSDAILVLTSGLKREVAAGKGLDPVALAPTVCSASASGVRSACASGRPSERASSLVCVFVCRLAASEGGCNTPDPRFIFRRVCVSVCSCLRACVCVQGEGIKTQKRGGQERRKRRTERRRKAAFLK